jgi:uncharacterized protein (TIGR02186 family)
MLGVLAWGASLLPAPDVSARPGRLPLTVEPARVVIGVFHGGVDVAVSAETEPGVDVAVLVTGPASELVMRTQARRWGLFWAPAGEVTFESVPSLYLLRTTAELQSLAPAHILEGLGIGYEALRPALGEGARDDLFRELVLLKESEGLFSSTIGGGEDLGASAAGGPSFQTVLHIPARAPARTYSIQLCAFREGQLVGRGEGTLTLEEGDFVEFVSSLAETHGLAYGVFAVVVAIASGLLVGFLFGSTSKKG